VWPSINLETHVEDVVSHIEQERLEDIVLCGHSYGGMVIAGAASRLPGRVRTLLFIDALVPLDRDSVWSMFKAPQRDVMAGNTSDGVTTNPPPGLDPRTRPHPLACFMQPVSLGDAAYSARRKVFVWCKPWAEGAFAGVHDRVAGERDWEVLKVPFGHDVMNEAPDQTRDIIRAVAEDRALS
jgi:pimeloyl-ACP methyl ester carboxylesterase